MDKNQKGQKIFPKAFLWGASTSAHQVEGEPLNDWSVWELEHAHVLAKTAHKRLGWLPVWDEIKHQAEDPYNYISGRGVEHYERFREDFDIAKSLNLNAFRFGIEWSRLEPEEGMWDQEAIDHYKTYIAELKKRHIEPMPNLWHWSMPIWFTDLGGFEKKANLRYFERFVQKFADELLDGVNFVITLNEPNVYTTYGYLTGDPITGMWPPAKRSLRKSLLVYQHLALAHRQAYVILKQAKPKLQVGLAAQLANIQAYRPHNFFDELSTKVMRYGWNWWFLRRVRNEQDFVGVNYYFSDYYTGLAKRKSPSVPLNDMGWYMEPEGLYPLLLRAWAHYHKPIIVTENGVADRHDQYRQWWIEESIVAMERALSEGVEIHGYFHWSLLDNFEWAYGWWPKFGLVAVDREHGMKRTIRPSAKWFAKRIKDLEVD